MGKEGLEPSPQRDMILSHARLPIPPLPRRELVAIIVKGSLWHKPESLDLNPRDIFQIQLIGFGKDAGDNQLGKAKYRLNLADTLQI